MKDLHIIIHFNGYIYHTYFKCLSFVNLLFYNHLDVFYIPKFAQIINTKRQNNEINIYQ